MSSSDCYQLMMEMIEDWRLAAEEIRSKMGCYTAKAICLVAGAAFPYHQVVISSIHDL